MSSGTVLRRLWTLAGPVRGRMLLAGLLGALATGSAVALMGVSGWLIARASQQPPVLTLMVAVVGVRAFGIGRGVLRYLERLLSHDVALRVLASLRGAMVDRLAAVAPAGLPVWRRAELQARVIGDVDDVQDLLLRVLLPLFGGGVVSVATVMVMASLHPGAGLLLAVCLVLAAVLAPLLQVRRLRETEEEDVRLRAERTALVAGTFAHLTELTALGGLDERLDTLRAMEAATTRLHGRRTFAAAVATGVGVAAVGLASALALWFGAPSVTSGELPAVLLAVVVLTPLALAETVGAIGTAAAALPRSMAAARRVLAVLDTPDPLPAQRTGVMTTVPTDPAGPVIRLEGVSARWPGAEVDAISDIDLELRPGQRVLLLGESGSGKSTLLAVLLGFLEPRTGRITVNGVPADRIDREARRTLFAWTGDPAHTFATSAAENLRFARPGCTDAELTAVLERVGLGPWVRLHGLDGRLGEGGTTVSGGEQQRFALARALLADRPVLLADEALAHLDPAGARGLREELLAPSARCTVVVSHRREDAALVDRVIELSRGRVRRPADVR